MILKGKNKVNTDQAWHNVYCRLEKDGLIPEKKNTKNRHLFQHATVKWAAAVAIICIAATSVIFYQKNNVNEHTGLITLHNEKGSVTLVTTLEDGSIVYLSDNTQLHYPEHFSLDKREVILNGNALFDVSANKERPFLIETEHIQIEVIGTSFNVESTDHLPFELSVQHGEVKVTYKKNGESVHVKAGETVKLSSNRLLLKPSEDHNDVNHYTSRIRFKDEKLTNILHVINKQSKDVILQTVPSLEDRQLTVTFDNNTPESMAELLCTAFNLTYKIDNNVLLISEP